MGSGGAPSGPSERNSARARPAGGTGPGAIKPAWALSGRANLQLTFQPLERESEREHPRPVTGPLERKWIVLIGDKAGPHWLGHATGAESTGREDLRADSLGMRPEINAGRPIGDRPSGSRSDSIEAVWLERSNYQQREGPALCRHLFVSMRAGPGGRRLAARRHLADMSSGIQIDEN